MTVWKSFITAFPKSKDFNFSVNVFYYSIPRIRSTSVSSVCVYPINVLRRELSYRKHKNTIEFEHIQKLSGVRTTTRRETEF